MKKLLNMPDPPEMEGLRGVKGPKVETCYVEPTSRTIVDLMDYYGRGMLITRINVPKASRGQGRAREIMRRVLRDADASKTYLYLEIVPSDGLSYEQLREWYERLGFKDFASLGVWRRKPQ